MSTPHNSAEYGDFAKTVLMPGDPLRAKWIAETFLADARLVTSVRNVLGYTGKWQGKPVSVMASGMGMPSIGIYSYELFHDYGVDHIIRIGSAGAYSGDLDVMDLVLADSAWSESSFGRTQNEDPSDIRYPSAHLNETILAAAQETGKKLALGPIHSSDVFYRDEKADGGLDRSIEEKGLLCVEMESFALFHNADVLGKQAACLLTISDSFVSKKAISAQERQEAFADMVTLALDAAVKL